MEADTRCFDRSWTVRRFQRNLYARSRKHPRQATFPWYLGFGLIVTSGPSFRRSDIREGGYDWFQLNHRGKFKPLLRGQSLLS